jgi:hypothetical protein
VVVKSDVWGVVGGICWVWWFSCKIVSMGTSFNRLMLAEVNLRRWRWNELGGLDPDGDAAQVKCMM